MEAFAQLKNEQNMMSEELRELEARLAAARETSERVDALLTLAQHLSERDSDRAWELAESAQLLAAALEDKARQVGSHLALAQILYQRRDYAGSVSHALRALDLARAEKLDEQTAHALGYLGAGHEVAGAFPEALGCYSAALRIHERIADRQGIARQLSSIGLLYHRTGDDLQAEHHLTQALALARRIGSHLTAAAHLSSLALVYEKLGRVEQALAAVQESLAFYEAEQDFAGSAAALVILGDIQMRQGAAAAAARSYRRAAASARRGKAPQSEAHVQTLLARLDLDCGRPGAALPRLERALARFARLDSQTHLAETYELLARACKALDQFEKALAHYEAFHQAREAFFSAQADSRLKILQAIYQVETARQEAETEIEQEIAHREQLIADLDTYADYVAHNLKNPIGNILGFAELMLLDGEQLSEERQLYIRSIMTSATKMDQIIEALLRLARVRLEKMPTVAVDMNAIINEVQQRLAPQLERYHGALYVAGALPDALAYGPWVEEIWVNYITNGLKYGGSPPQITLGAERLDDGFVRYWVRDNGDGISPQKQRQLFNKFERLGIKKVEGFGLGLAMVRQIVEQLKGRVGVESSGEPGQGATFYFDLPASK